MATVTAAVLGGNTLEKQAETIGELKSLMNVSTYTAKINGEIVPDDYHLSNGEVVVFTYNAKGA
jgi:hypothetical protein